MRTCDIIYAPGYWEIINNITMKKAIIWLAIFSLLPASVLSQNFIKGKILDQETMVPVSSAHIKEYDKESDTVSNNAGVFTFKSNSVISVLN